MKGVLSGDGIADYDRATADFDEAIRLNPKGGSPSSAVGEFMGSAAPRPRQSQDFELSGPT